MLLLHHLLTLSSSIFAFDSARACVFTGRCFVSKRVTHLQSNKSLRLCHDNVHKNVGSPFTCDMTHSHMLYHSHDFGELLPRILALTPSHHMVSNKAAQTLTTDYVFHSHSVQHEPLTYHLACVGMLYEYFSVFRMPLPHISKRHINSECETISQAHTHYTQTPHTQDDGPQETRRGTKRQWRGYRWHFHFLSMHVAVAVSPSEYVLIYVSKQTTVTIIITFTVRSPDVCRVRCIQRSLFVSYPFVFICLCLSAALFCCIHFSLHSSVESSNVFRYIVCCFISYRYCVYVFASPWVHHPDSIERRLATLQQNI